MYLGDSDYLTLSLANFVLFMCLIEMERSSNFIKNIDNMKYTLKLVVRIVDLWFDETEDKVEQAEMVIIRMLCY